MTREQVSQLMEPLKEQSRRAAPLADPLPLCSPAGRTWGRT